MFYSDEISISKAKRDVLDTIYRCNIATKARRARQLKGALEYGVLVLILTDWTSGYTH